MQPPRAWTATFRGIRRRRSPTGRLSWPQRSAAQRRAPSARSAPGRSSSARLRSASNGRAHRRDAASRFRPAARVPVLALSGGYDMRRPTSKRCPVTRRFPHGRLLVVPAVGTASSAPTSRSARSARCAPGRRTGNVPATCQRPSFIVAPPGALSLRGSPGEGRRRRKPRSHWSAERSGRQRRCG